MSKPYTVDVIIPSYRPDGKLKQLVSRLQQQTHPIYNILIMEEKQTIVACGAGTISKRVYPDGRIERCDNVKDVAGYIERIEEMIERKKELYKDS